MKRITPELAIDNCSEVLEFYQRVFGGKIQNVQKADGIEMFKGHEGKTIHAELRINDECLLYMNDNFGKKTAGGNIHLVLEMDSEEELNRIFDALSERGSVGFAPQKTFWGAIHAVVTDYAGITWGLNFTLK